MVRMVGKEGTLGGGKGMNWSNVMDGWKYNEVI